MERHPPRREKDLLINLQFLNTLLHDIYLLFGHNQHRKNGCSPRATGSPGKIVIGTTNEYISQSQKAFRC